MVEQAASGGASLAKREPRPNLRRSLGGHQDEVAHPCHSNVFEQSWSRRSRCPPLAAPRPTIRPIRFACRSIRASRTFTTSVAIERWRSAWRRLQAALPNAWSIHITAARKMGAANASAPGNIEDSAHFAPDETTPRGPPFTNRKCRAQAASAGPWRFASCPASGSAGRLRSQRRSRLCRGPTVRRRTHCIAPRNSARQGMKFDARHRTVHPQMPTLDVPRHSPSTHTQRKPM